MFFHCKRHHKRKYRHSCVSSLRRSCAPDMRTCTAGWQHHFVSNARYHFVLPALKGPKSMASPHYFPSIVEAKLNGSNVGVPTLAPEQESHSSLYTAPASIVDSHTHLLHGVVHLNGYGHLLRINGMEGGSVHLTGCPGLVPVLSELRRAECCGKFYTLFAFVLFVGSEPCYKLHPHTCGFYC